MDETSRRVFKWQLTYDCYYLLKGPVADAMDAPQPSRLIVQPFVEDDDDGEVFSAFPF